MGMMASVLEEQGIPFAGGAVMNASSWLSNQFELCNDGRFFVPVEPEPQAFWEGVWSGFLSKQGPGQIGTCTVLINLAANVSVHMVSGHFDKYVKSILGDKIDSISMHLIRGFLLKDRVRHLMLIRKLVEAGYRVIWLSDPPTQPRFESLFSAFDTCLCEILKETGCHVFPVRAWVQAQGGLPERYRSAEIDHKSGVADWQHGSRDYYRELFEAIAQKYAIDPLKVGA